MQRLGALAFGRQQLFLGDLLPEDEVPFGSHLCLPDGRDCRDFGVYPDREVCASPQVSVPSPSQIHHHLRSGLSSFFYLHGILLFDDFRYRASMHLLGSGCCCCFRPVCPRCFWVLFGDCHRFFFLSARVSILQQVAKFDLQ